MRFSVIIPTLNEAPRISGLVARVREDNPDCEIIIVDGGSTDGTVELSADSGARVLHTARGRGRQLAHAIPTSN